MAKIKSTLDLIMEKTKHLSLSEEERQALEEQELNKRVQALLVRYLNEERGADFLAHELDRLPPGKGEEGRRLCRELLAATLSLFGDDERVFGAVGRLFGLEERERWEKAVAPLKRRFREALAGARQEAGTRCLQDLATLGLKGPALLPCVNDESPFWREEEDKQAGTFQQAVKAALDISHR